MSTDRVCLQVGSHYNLNLRSKVMVFWTIVYRGQNFHSSACNYGWNLERTSNSSQSTRPVGRMLWKELYVLEEVILHITLLCSLLHTLFKDKCICLQDECKLKVTRPAGQVQYWNIFVPWIEHIFGGKNYSH